MAAGGRASESRRATPVGFQAQRIGYADRQSRMTLPLRDGRVNRAAVLVVGFEPTRAFAQQSDKYR